MADKASIVLPTPVIRLTENRYNTEVPGKAVVTFEWTKGIIMDVDDNLSYDSAEFPETITYEVLEDDTRVDGGTLVENSGGEPQKGSVTVTVKSGRKITIRVVNGLTDGSDSKIAELTFYTPVDNTTFTIPVTWDEQRHIVTVTARCPGCASVRVRAGYQPGDYDIGEKVTTDTAGSLTVSNPRHGNGEVLYFTAIPRSTDGHEYPESAAFLAIEVPNPILGVLSETEGNQNIVDIVEHKKDDTITQKWQTTWPRTVEKK